MNLSLFSKATAVEANKLRQRITYYDAQQIMLGNHPITVDGTERWFCIADLGLSVYEIGLAPTSAWQTEVVKYIPSLRDDGTKLFNL